MLGDTYDAAGVEVFRRGTWRKRIRNSGMKPERASLMAQKNLLPRVEQAPRKGSYLRRRYV
jgi:hypothetical protein